VGIRDKIFDSKILAALGHALEDEDWTIRQNMVKFFTAAIAQSMPYFFSSVFILNIW